VTLSLLSWMCFSFTPVFVPHFVIYSHGIRDWIWILLAWFWVGQFFHPFRQTPLFSSLVTFQQHNNCQRNPVIPIWKVGRKRYQNQFPHSAPSFRWTHLLSTSSILSSSNKTRDILSLRWAITRRHHSYAYSWSKGVVVLCHGLL